MDEENDDPVDALESLRNAIGPGELPNEDRTYARRLLSQTLSGASRRRTDETYGSLDQDAETAREALRNARKRLLSRPAYDQRDKYLAVGAQLIGGRSPSGRFGDGVSDAVTALLKERGLERQGLDRRDAQEFELDKELFGIDSGVNTAKRSLSLKREELDANLARSALNALRTPGIGGRNGGVGQDPMNIKEWRVFSKMSPADQTRYLQMRRASMVKDINEIPTFIDPSGNTRPLTDPTTANAAAAAREAAKAAGKNQGDAAGNLAGIISTAETNLNDIRTLKSHPGLKYLTGAFSLSPIVPNTDQAEAFSYIEKLNGATFLEAFNSLRGSGQITEAEGKKATAALSRLGTRGMKLEAYQSAISDLEDVMARGIANAKRKGMAIPAGVPGAMSQAAPAPAAPAPPQPRSTEDLLNQYGAKAP